MQDRVPLLPVDVRRSWHRLALHMKASSLIETKSHEASAASMCGGTPEETCLRVEHLGECWIVENCMGESLGDAAEREAAIELARLALEAQDASCICVHTLDGSVEQTLCA